MKLIVTKELEQERDLALEYLCAIAPKVYHAEGITPHAILGKSQTNPLPELRKILWRALANVGHSVTLIARASNKNHATVIAALRLVDEWKSPIVAKYYVEQLFMIEAVTNELMDYRNGRNKGATSC